MLFLALQFLFLGVLKNLEPECRHRGGKGGEVPRDAEVPPAVHLVQSIISGSSSTGGFGRINGNPLRRETCCMSSPPVFKDRHIPRHLKSSNCLWLVGLLKFLRQSWDPEGPCSCLPQRMQVAVAVATHYADVAVMVPVGLRCTITVSCHGKKAAFAGCKAPQFC